MTAVYQNSRYPPPGGETPDQRAAGDARDARAVADVLAGSPQAFEDIVRRYGRTVHGLMLRCCGDAETAADLAQDALVRAYERLDRYDPAQRFFPWLYALALNVARDHLRARRRAPRTDELPETLPARPDGAERRLDGQAAMQALAGLPEDYREALLLRFREDCSMAEIAQALGIGVSGAKMRVSRGLAMLREVFFKPRSRS
ncbi:MAG: RNA polymerase sigma factor [Desulfovibrionaceae bacterium]